MSPHCNEPPAIAYSYVRFSSPDQAKGDSLRRQTEATEAWCQRNNVCLDRSTTLHDLGRSAFTGKHRENPDRNALAAFLKLVERGRVPRGSFLVLENLDRLSREHIQPALLLALNLLQAGIRIVQLNPSEMIFDDKSDTMPVMMMMLELSRGHSESKAKSFRSAENWRRMRREARENGGMLNRTLPDWIEVCGGKRCIKAGAKATILRIFELAASGYGEVRIKRLFRSEGVPCFARSGKWTQSYIAKLLKDRRLLGEFQPRSGKKPDGEPIEGYFPRVLTEAQFYAGFRAATSRKSLPGDIAPVKLKAVDELHAAGKTVSEIARQLSVSRQQVYRALLKLGRRKQPAGKARQVYLFNGLIREYWKDSPFLMKSEHGAGRAIKVLVSEDRRQSFPYFVIERAILHELRELDPKEVLDGANGHSDVVALEGEHGAVESELAEIDAFMDTNGFSPSLGKRIAALESRLADVNIRLAAARQKAANPLSASWGEIKTLLAALDSAVDQEDARLRLRAALRRIIAGIRMAVPFTGSMKIAMLTIEFAGEHADRFREMTVWYRRTSGNQHKRYPGKWAVVSAAGQGKPIDFMPSDEPGEPPISFPSEWLRGVPAKPSEWFDLPD